MKADFSRSSSSISFPRIVKREGPESNASFLGNKVTKSKVCKDRVSGKARVAPVMVDGIMDGCVIFSSDRSRWQCLLAVGLIRTRCR